MKPIHLLIAVFLCLSTSISAIDLNIDATIEYQTIEGFGAHGAMDVWWSGGPFYNQAFLDFLIDDMGLTMTRNNYYPPDDGPVWTNKQVSFLQAMRDKAQESGEPLKMIASYWTPPASMKTNNSTIGGSLLPSMYESFGNFAVETAQTYEDAGLDLYALSLQNEPLFNEPYNSCVYTAETYRDMVRVVGPIFKNAWPDVKLFGCEGMAHSSGALEARTFVDPQAGQYMDRLAVHGYADGISPTPESLVAVAYTKLGLMSAQFGAPLWMTETSGFGLDWTGAQTLAATMYSALKYGKLSAWVWWQIHSTDGVNTFEVATPYTNPPKRYYISKQFYRYIRPDAKMVEVDDTSDPNLFALAFTHLENQTLTIVLVNSASEVKNVNFTNADIPASFSKHVTTSSKNCANEGVYNSSQPLLVEQGVTTLVATGYTPPSISISDRMSGNQIKLSSANLSGQIFSLDGKLIRTLSNVELALCGAVKWDGRDTNGQRVARGSYYSIVTDRHGKKVHSRTAIDIR